MFWKVVSNLPKEKRARLMQFATGTCNLPAGGFAELWGSNGKQPFCIDMIKDKPNSLPVAHTCFNRIDLPLYPSEDVMLNKLSMAIEECGGFGMQ